VTSAPAASHSQYVGQSLVRYAQPSWADEPVSMTFYDAVGMLFCYACASTAWDVIIPVR